MSTIAEQSIRRPFIHPRDHLIAELQLLELRTHREIARLRAARLLTGEDFQGLFVSDALLDALLAGHPGYRDEFEAFEERIADMREVIDGQCAESDEEGLPLARLQRSFALGSFELGAVVAAAAVDVDARFTTLFSFAQNDANRTRPTIDLILRLLATDSEGRASARNMLVPHATLRENRIIRIADEPHDRDLAWPLRAVSLDESMVETLLGIDQLDRTVSSHASLLATCRSADGLVLTDETRERIAPFLGTAPAEGLVVLSGPAGAGRQRIAEGVCAASGRPLIVVDAESFGRDAMPLDESFAVLSREAVLRGAGVLLREFDEARAIDQTVDYQRVVERLARDVPIVFVATDAEWHPSFKWRGPTPMVLEVPAPPLGLRAAVWGRFLEDAVAGEAVASEKTTLASTFSLTPGRVEAAVRTAQHIARTSGVDMDVRILADAVRATSADGLRRLADRLPLAYARQDIVLPGRISSQLDEICRLYRHRETVYGLWGFRRTRPTGAGLKVLFAGPSGTGKSMAAQIVARELGVDIYRVDLATIVDKYIGETEKHLRALFSEARHVNGAILFDEADALFGKRSQVKDAHDRYANVEVGFLLQQLETFDGIAILATNLRANIDEAFMRRLDAVLDFPSPDAAHREDIWRRMIPRGAPVGPDVDLRFLAERFELSGGNICNCAIAAAFAAADEDCPIAMRHLVVAVANEYLKLGKLPSRSDFGEFFDLLRDARTGGPS